MPMLPLVVFSYGVLGFLDVVWWGLGRGAEGGGLFSGVCSLPGLTEEVHPCIFFPLGLVYTYPVRWHRGSPYAAVSGVHQCDCNPTLDIPARLRVRFPPLGFQANG